MQGEQLILYFYMEHFINVNPIVNFLVKHGLHKDKEKLKEQIVKHLNYRTIFVLWHKDEIAAVIRWNIKEDTAYICDLTISCEHRKTRLINWLINNAIPKGLTWYPQVRYISWERETKYPERGVRKYMIDNLLKGVKHGN